MCLNKSNLFFKVLITIFLVNLTITIESSHAFTNVQTSTSMGLYNDYNKDRHFPLYHSWSIKGFYEGGLETSIEFFLNNDFTENKWNFYPTQAQITVPLFTENTHLIKHSEVKLGRQLYTEGFDIALLDGAQAPIRWSHSGGFMPILGNLRSTDFEQNSSSENNPLLGLIIWDSIADIHMRAGYTARDTNLTNHLVFASGQYQFEQLLWQPSVFLKTEWLADQMAFNQSSYELMAHFSKSLDGRVAYSNLDPRPTDHITYTSYIYRLFSISPTETIMSDLSWSQSENLIVNLSTENAFYNSGFQNETADRQDVSVDFQMRPGQWISPSVTYLKSYGGNVKDFGLRYTSELSTISKLMTEINMAYITKINQLNGWAEHIRGGYETHFWDRAKIGFAVEVERNHYYIFDTRAQVYVTNYL